MGKRVEAGAGRDVRRHACGQFRVADRDDGIMDGWKITFLVRVASWVMTRLSEPVPAVVGTATTGAIRGIRAGPPVADILEIPHGPGLARHEGDDLPGVQRRAAAERHDAVVTPRARMLRARGRRSSRPGWAISEKTAASAPASCRSRRAFAVMGCVAGKDP